MCSPHKKQLPRTRRARSIRGEDGGRGGCAANAAGSALRWSEVSRQGPPRSDAGPPWRFPVHAAGRRQGVWRDSGRHGSAVQRATSALGLGWGACKPGPARQGIPWQGIPVAGCVARAVLGRLLLQAAQPLSGGARAAWLGARWGRVVPRAHQASAAGGAASEVAGVLSAALCRAGSGAGAGAWTGAV